MHGVASVALAFAMAATLGGGVSAAPTKVSPDGREELHTQEQHFPSIFGSDGLRYLPLFNADVWRPPFGLGKPVKVETDGPEGLHIEEHHFLYFFGSDLWPHWVFAHAGILWSPAGLSNEGFTLKLLINGGAYRYISGALDNTTILGRQSSITAMPGWRFKRGGYEVTVYAGYDLQDFRFTPDDPGTNLRGRHLGLRGGFELWHEPSATTMLTADASVSSIGAGNSTRIAYGWRVLDRFYLGPEVQAFSADHYQHMRLGIHVTAFKTEDREWSGAIGYARDSDHRSGYYIRVGVLTRR